MPNSKSKTLSDFGIATDIIETAFEEIMRSKSQLGDLKHIFKIAMKDPALFPHINLFGVATYRNYLERWVKNYEDAMLNLPSERGASPKSSCPDPAIKTIVQYATKVNDIEAENQIQQHNLFMSAENIQGNLLEEYIASSVRQYGWIWCMGNVLRAVDFCTIDGSTLLQIKNKYNTENSSSSAIRSGTSIKKWYRLGTKTVNGKRIPVYKWDILNAIIQEKAVSSKPLPACNMDESKYQAFLKMIASKNPRIITYL